MSAGGLPIFESYTRRETISQSYVNKPSSTLFGIKPLIEQRELLIQFTKRVLLQESKGSALGVLWLVLKPLLLLSLYVFVFGYIFEGKFTDSHEESRPIYAIGIFVGLNVIHFLGEILAASPRSIIDNQSLVKNAIFPLEVLPTAMVGKASIEFVITSTLMIIGLLVFGIRPGINALWFFPISFGLILFGQGLAYALATFGVFLRDISQITQVASMGLLFASAVFYPVSKIPPAAWAILKFNPALIAVDAYRSTVLWNQPLAFNGQIVYFFVFSIGFYLLGYNAFSKYKRVFADYM